MTQSALTVTPPNPTPPTNLSSVGATPPLDPAQAAVDDGYVVGTSDTQANRILFAAKTAAAGAGTSVDAEGRGAETSFTQTYSSAIYNPSGPLVVAGAGPALAAAPAMPAPNAAHPSAPAAPTLTTIAPTTSVHATASVALTATGTNFTPTSSIYINGMRQPTTFVSATSLKCTATPAAVAGTSLVTVRDASGRETASQNWTIS